MLAFRAEAILLLALLAVPRVLSLTAPTCEVKEYCPGYELDTIASGVTVQEILNGLRNDFCGCKRIGGNINVLFPPPMPTDDSLTEDSFNMFYHLEEVGGRVLFVSVPPINTLILPELVLIRGNGLDANGNALTLADSRVDQFVLPKLVEISMGNMLLDNSTWCGYYTVNWEDILEAGSVVLLPNDEDLNFTEELDMRCSMAERQCSSECASGHCWAAGDNTTCQTLTKTVCPGPCIMQQQRCYVFDNTGPTPLRLCCDSMCAAGCTGHSESNCVACKQFNNNGTCVESCPRKLTYDIATSQYVVNPDGRVAAGNQCLVNCPPGLFDLDGSCDVSCPANHMIDSNTCVACVGPCPSGTECQGWSATEAVKNDVIMEEFLNNECVIVNGHIRFNQVTAECRNGSGFCDPSDALTDIILQRFQYVRVIRGQLQISGWDLNTYPALPRVIDYFRNVEYIGSLNLTLETVNTDGDALVISTNPGLGRVDLSRLRQVRYGNVRVRRNPELCYVGDFQTTMGSDSVYLIETELILPTDAEPNFQSVDDCNAAGMTCDVECVQTSRCWGPADTNCVGCVNYRYPPLWRCVPNCDEYNETFPNNDTKECEQCHDECIGCCNQGPFQCKVCRNFRIVHDPAGADVECHTGTECVATCPMEYYEDGMDCKLCHDLCVGGCTGPGNFVGQGGCNACAFVNFSQNDTQISCVAQCPPGTYLHQLDQAIGPVPTGNGACHPCHELCETCFGPQNTECFTCKHAAVENTTGAVTVTTCLSECPTYRYLAASKICRPCHEECVGCTGQGNKMCIECRNLRVVVTETPTLTYECLATCPNSSYWVDDEHTCILCHPLCAMCIAPGNNNCTQCKAIEAMRVGLGETITVDGVNRTLYTCEATQQLGCGDSGETFPNNDTKECEQCHDECIGCCNQGPFQCKACRNFRIVHDPAGADVECHTGTECVATCPKEYNEDGMDCKLCHDLCVGGCTGPGNFVGQGGCNACAFANFSQNDTQISCVVQCPPGTYLHQLDQAIGPVPTGNGACHPCHELCETCFGPQNTECFTCKHAGVENTTEAVTVTTCLTECPTYRYLATSKICRPCHEECDGCTGQGNKMCIECSHLRVVVTETPTLTYECLAFCPNSSYWIDDEDTCIPCHPLCAMCIAPGNDNCFQCKAIQATPIGLGETITVDGINRTLYTCEATQQLGSDDSGNMIVGLPWWAWLLLAVGLPLVLILILSVIVPFICLVFICLASIWRKKRKLLLEQMAPTVDRPANGIRNELALEMEV